MVDKLPNISVSLGEPAGVGPDVFLRSMGQALAARVVVFTDIDFIRARAAQLGLAVTIELLPSVADAQPHRPNHIQVIHVPLQAPVRLGQLDPLNAHATLLALKSAALFASSTPDTYLLTGPVDKALLSGVESGFIGHTEYLAELSELGHDDVLMMFASDLTYLALMTTHIPISAVASAINSTLIIKRTRLFAHALKTHFGCRVPRIAVLGLNPHAGERGKIGTEELDVIFPALETLSADKSIRVDGPISGDTAFTPEVLSAVDGVMAMYHDQGLAPFKALNFFKSVNITVGLPYVRLSVDHGTALSIAGTNKVNSEGFAYALATALRIHSTRSSSHA